MENKNTKEMTSLEEEFKRTIMMGYGEYERQLRSRQIKRGLQRIKQRTNHQVAKK